MNAWCAIRKAIAWKSRPDEPQPNTLRDVAMKILVALLFAGLLAPRAVAQQTAPAWPPVTQSAKPWTRWWWPGSAVDKAQLTAQLTAIAKAGIGGVEITPIYGVRGGEAHYIDFLSPRWMEMLEHTTAEAARLGLGVDMATGTGWPFGGPSVIQTDGSSGLALIDGKLTGKPTAMKVKRPAPGGEGLVLDPYSPAALDRYLRPFSKALAELPGPGAGGRGLRSQFHDSFEYYNASWTAQLPAVFRQMHGYDIQTFAVQLGGEQPIDDDTLGRIKGDYRRTLARLHLDYVNAWVAWAHAEGFKARNQAHGAPGNLLDLYGVADIPETESFGLTALPIVGLRTDPVGVSVDPDPPSVTIGRFASSAAHVMGRPLASSETLTWLRENFRESPAAAKPQIDRLFAAGINHIFYHGTVYSPADARWPGWFFYAATQLATTNPLWEDFGAMHGYVARVQSVLQGGSPDNDILLYWPFDDVVDRSDGLMHQYGVHDNKWLTEAAAGRIAAKLLDSGYSFDFISDAQLDRVRVKNGTLATPGASYRVIVIPATRRMPAESLARLAELAKQGAKVIFESLPQDVPGYGRLEARRAELRGLLSSARLAATVSGDDLVVALEKHKVRREQASQSGLAHIRRARTDGHDYFFANLGGKAFDGWLQLGIADTSALLLDPLSGRAGTAAARRIRGADLQVYLQLASGESAIVRTYRTAKAQPATTPWHYLMPAAEGLALQGDWQLEFIEGGPALPAGVRMNALASWTSLADPLARRFAGTARYRLEFARPAGLVADEWLLDLGDVRESARVTFNGESLGTAWSLPYRLRLGSRLEERNTLEIEVTNLPANRIRDLDAAKVPWKIMRDINIASVKYRPFDASGWEVEPAGLLGPVRLVPARLVSPR
jgi:hypothetical protein